MERDDEAAPQIIAHGLASRPCPRGALKAASCGRWHGLGIPRLVKVSSSRIDTRGFTHLGVTCVTARRQQTDRNAGATGRVVMARTSDRSGAVGIVVMVVGVIFALAGIVTYVLVSNELASENITVSKDAKYFAGKDVTRPVHRLLGSGDDQQARPRGDRRQDLRRARQGRPAAGHRHAGLLPSGLAVHLGGRLRRRRAGRRARRHAGSHRLGPSIVGTSGRGAGRRQRSRTRHPHGPDRASSS